MKIHSLPVSFLLMLVLAACQSKSEQRTSIMSGAFDKKETVDADNYDLEGILNSGELIVATISGPNTYYDYHGIPMGLQYALAENFANSEGVTVRVELVKDTMALVDLLENGEVDVVAYPLSETFIAAEGLVAAGYDKTGSWAVRKDAKALAAALDNWYVEGVETRVQTAETERVKQSRHVTRRAQSVYLSRDRGVISVYDNLFKDAQAITGWDWRLIAAQCYQESAFDPNARSYVGARGLMQLMPATARELGLTPEEIPQPEKNVNAGARYIAKLTKTFSDIPNPDERIKFVLASYNGGSFHVRDAMALAKKYGKNPHQWDDVAPYILGLQQARFYTDPVVKHGYMIGSETANYVYSILERWRDYGGKVAITHAPQLPPDNGAAAPASSPSASNRPVRKNRFSSGTRVMRPDDPDFNQMEN